MRTNPPRIQGGIRIQLCLLLFTIAGAVNVVAAELPRVEAVAKRSANTTLRLPPGGSAASADFPQSLAETGAFVDLTTLAPQPGLVPYDLNVPLWSDGAHKSRWFSVPDTNLTITFRREGNWLFPTGTVFVKHFSLPLTNGAPESVRRLETRFLVAGTNGYYGVTYRWGDSRTDAVLVPANGTNENLSIYDGTVMRTQVWRYPARAECLRCHSRAAGYVLGFNTAQLNRDVACGDGMTNQIGALHRAGYFQTNQISLHALPALARATNTDISLEYRVRSYLAANCAHCHVAQGDCPTPWTGPITNTTAEAKIIDGLLLQSLGDPANRVIKPGDPAHSMMLTRISTPGAWRMPPLATSVLDTQAIALVTAWITNDLARYQTYADWSTAQFGRSDLADAAEGADPDGDGAPNQLEYLTQSDPLRPGDPWSARIASAPSSSERAESSSGVSVQFSLPANRGHEVQWTTNLADRTSWQPLDAPGNTPSFASTPRRVTVDDPDVTALRKFYRVRLRVP